MKETKKFSREAHYLYYLYKMEDSYNKINNELEKVSFCISKTCLLSGLTREKEAKYLFPLDIFVIVRGNFGEINPCKISLTIEYFSYPQDDLSASERYILDQIEKIAKEHNLE